MRRYLILSTIALVAMVDRILAADHPGGLHVLCVIALAFTAAAGVLAVLIGFALLFGVLFIGTAEFIMSLFARTPSRTPGQ